MKKPLLTSMDKELNRFQCYPENYTSKDQVGPDLKQNLIKQLELIKQNCYQVRGCDLSLYRFVELLKQLGYSEPKYLTFSVTQDVILSQ